MTQRPVPRWHVIFAEKSEARDLPLSIRAGHKKRHVPVAEEGESTLVLPLITRLHREDVGIADFPAGRGP